MQYVTSRGDVVQIGSVDRRVLDRAVPEKPSPPLREVVTWGGEVEHVPKYNDPQYTRQLSDWRVLVFEKQWAAIAPAIVVESPNMDESAALNAVGIGDGSALDWLHHACPRVDQANIVRAVFYLSTVTELGMQEAEQRFAYTWRKKPVSAWSVSYTNGARSAIASHWRAAFRSHLSWREFCKLSGPEQSEIVVFWALEDRLSYLIDKYDN